MESVVSRTSSVTRDIDALNAQDPRHDLVDGQQRPRELVYAERMSEVLSKIYPSAGDLLRIAARGQHVRRWDIPRSGYPLGRDGYNHWRMACRAHHASIVSGLVAQHGFNPDDIAHVEKAIRKEGIKRDADAQALENVAAVVFIQFHLEAFALEHTSYDEAKFVGILRKTLRKMDAHGHAFVADLAIPANLKQLLGVARMG